MDLFISKIKMKFFEKQIERIKNIKTRNLGPFDNVVLVMLFVFFKKRVGEKMCRNMCNVV